MTNDINENCPEGELLVYQDSDFKQPVRVLFSGKTVWPTQRLMVDLFQTTVANINIHIANILRGPGASSEGNH